MGPSSSTLSPITRSMRPRPLSPPGSPSRPVWPRESSRTPKRPARAPASLRWSRLRSQREKPRNPQRKRLLKRNLQHQKKLLLKNQQQRRLLQRRSLLPKRHHQKKKPAAKKTASPKKKPATKKPVAKS